jgi:hypothetical protein
MDEVKRLIRDDIQEVQLSSAPLPGTKNLVQDAI